MDEQTRLKAREYLLRSRIYRFMALAFAAIGLVIFIVLYFRHVDGNILHAIRRPSVILIMLVPFLPAFVLSRMAMKSQNKFMALLQSVQEQKDPVENRKDAGDSKK